MVPFFLLACVETILSQYPSPTYQDIMVQDQIVAVGTNSCAPRYERIKPVFDSFQKPFKVLEIGAAQGYFSFRIAQEYPQASCVMIEEDNHHYGYHGSLLEELCHLNNHLKNVSLIQKNINP
jgi:tRNA G46 methylase TrmB